MANKLSFTGISDIAFGKDLKRNEVEGLAKSSLTILNSVSFFLAGVSILFVVSFKVGNSLSLTWFFVAEALAFLLIPILARQGFINTAKLLLIIYADVGIIILSNSFGSEILIQAFFVPAMGLSILLFEQKNVNLRNIAILLSIISYFVTDFINFEEVRLSADGESIIRWSVLTASFVTTWLIFNTFSDSKELAESRTIELLEKEKALNKELSANQAKLEEYIKQLEVTSDELVKSASAKSDFLATMSHEIRTPMNAILGMTHLLKQDNPREDQLESINILDFSGKTLLALIDDILDFSKIEAGKIEFEQVEFELKELVSTITETFRVTANNKGVKLIAEIKEDIPNVLIGDPARLTQILNNLISNALKFTEKGEVGLIVTALGGDEKTVTIQFKVYDHGIGIESDRLEFIFDSFTQANKQTKRLFGGTGLGLSISKQLTELQNGKIYAESEVGVGSTFTIELSFGRGTSDEKVNAGIYTETEEVNINGMKILLAEDNLVNQKVMKRFLERWNVEMAIVSNGEEAVEQVRKNNFDIILMDLQMPVMDGYEAASQIRKMDDPQKRRVPIVALTAAALKEVRGHVYASGMNGYITKPFNPVDLKKKLVEYTKG